MTRTIPRLQMIGIILDENTLNLIDLNDAKPTTKIYSSFRRGQERRTL